jgi:septal ring factor EnvC (AmiA/AmiB activator)
LTIIRRDTLEAEKKEKDRLAKLKANNDNTKVKPSSENKTTPTSGGAKVNAAEGGLKSTTDNRPYSALETTEEGRETSVSFETNRGNLPWPADKGYVYIHFGVENIPGTKLNRKSDGIELAAPKGTSVRSVANGKVSYVGDVNGDLTIIVQHGKYFTMYTYLNNATVNVGQEVKAGTVLGKSGVNLDGEGAISFMIYNEKGVALDPESWLKNRR